MPTDPNIPDAFQLDSGLREDMVISIASAYFAPDAAYMDGKQLMLWLIGTDENEDPVDVRMSVGSDWQTDDGNTITHPTKRNQRINKNSIYGHFLANAFEIPELARVLIERSEQYGDKGPLDARIWLDLIIHLEAKTIHYGRNIPDQDRLMPTEYMGLTSSTTTASVPVAAPPATAPQPDPAAILAQARAKAQQEVAVTNGSPLYSKALDLAKNSPDFNAFLGAAFADAEILADDDLAEQCADQNQIWAAAHPS